MTDFKTVMYEKTTKSYMVVCDREIVAEGDRVYKNWKLRLNLENSNYIVQTTSLDTACQRNTLIKLQVDTLARSLNARLDQWMLAAARCPAHVVPILERTYRNHEWRIGMPRYRIDLFEHLYEGGDKYDRTVAVPCMLQVAEGLACLHRHGLAHGDVKSENMLVAHDGTVMLADFDFSQPVGVLLVPRGTTAEFAPPDLILHPGTETYIDKVDVWAMGVMVYVAFMNQLPFGKDPTKSTWFADATVDAENLEFEDDIPPAVQGLLRKCWFKNPLHRCTMNDVVAVLREECHAEVKK